VEDNLEIFKMS